MGHTSRSRNGRRRLWSSDHKIPTSHNHIHRTRAQQCCYHSLIYYAAYRSTYAMLWWPSTISFAAVLCVLCLQASAIMPNIAPVAVANAVTGTSCADILSFSHVTSNSCTYIYIDPGGFIRTNQTFSRPVCPFSKHPIARVCTLSSLFALVLVQAHSSLCLRIHLTHDPHNALLVRLISTPLRTLYHLPHSLYTVTSISRDLSFLIQIHHLLLVCAECAVSDCEFQRARRCFRCATRSRTIGSGEIAEMVVAHGFHVERTIVSLSHCALACAGKTRPESRCTLCADHHYLAFFQLSSERI